MINSESRFPLFGIMLQASIRYVADLGTRDVRFGGRVWRVSLYQFVGAGVDL